MVPQYDRIYNALKEYIDTGTAPDLVDEIILARNTRGGGNGEEITISEEDILERISIARNDLEVCVQLIYRAVFDCADPPEPEWDDGGLFDY